MTFSGKLFYRKRHGFSYYAPVFWFHNNNFYYQGEKHYV